jgi:hypothetical protein
MSSAYEYLHRALKVPRFAPNSTRQVRQEGITKWIQEENERLEKQNKQNR